MGALRVRYRERQIELEIDQFDTGFASAPNWGGGRSSAIEILGEGTLVVCNALMWIVAQVAFLLCNAVVWVVPLVACAGWRTLRELTCLALACLGLLGRGLDVTGRAAARHSWLISTVACAAAQLPSGAERQELRSALARNHDHARN